MTFFSLITLAASVCCWIVSSVQWTALLRPKTASDMFLTFFLMSWAQISILFHVLSFTGAMGPVSVLAAHAALLILGTLLRRRTLAPPLPWPKRVDLHELCQSWRLPAFLKWGLAAWFVWIMLSTLYISMAVPQNHGDSVAYHLSRAAHWLQNQSIAHYHTELHRQNEMPLTAELGILWSMVFVRSDILAGLTQWFCLIPLVVVLYGILRQLAFSPTVSILSVATLVSLNQFIYQASSTQNDLIVTTFILCGLHFMLKGFAEPRRPANYLLLGSLAIGLALATKGYTLLWGPGVLILMIWAAARYRQTQPWRRAARFSLATAGFGLLFAGYGWIENWRTFHHLFLSPFEVRHQRVTDPDLTTLTSTAMKNWAWFCEPMTIGNALIGDENLHLPLMRLLKNTHAWLDINLSSPRTTIGEGKKFHFPDTPRTRITTHNGPLGFLLFWPAMIVTLIAGLARTLARNRLSSPTLNAAIWTLAGLTYFLTMSLLLGWQRPSGRLMMCFLCVGLPSVALIYSWAARLGRVVSWLFGALVAVFVLSASLEATLQNPRAPFIDVPDQDSILFKSRDELRDLMLHQDETLFPSLVVESLVPQSATLGLALNPRATDYPMFGPNLERRCVPLVRSELSREGIVASLEELGFDALLVMHEFDRVERSEPMVDRINITRQVTPEGITLFDWGDCTLAVREPLPISRYPGAIVEADGKQ